MFPFMAIPTVAFCMAVISSAQEPRVQYMDKLVSNARPRRALAQNDHQVNVDLSSYSLKFDQCQFVKAYNDDIAQDGDYDTVLATQRFVIFRLCPNGCSTCDTGYGEYLIDMDEYLDETLNYYQEIQQNMCKTCKNNCQYYGQAENQAQQANGGGGRRLEDTVDCDTCVTTCYKIKNMEANGYIDATKFLQCQKVQDGNDNGPAIYAGPICASAGTKVKIGVFSDENCMILNNDKDIEDYLADGNGNGMKLSYALFKSVYEDSCISCLGDNGNNNNGNNNNNNNNYNNKEICAELYEEAAKCESSHGFTGVTQYTQYYENQIDTESVVCDFISSLTTGTYSQEGEIVIKGSNAFKVPASSTTAGQKFTLVFFIFGSVGLTAYAAMLHMQLTKSTKLNLTSGGSLA